MSIALQIGGVAESIVTYAEANRIDLVAMCTRGRTGMGRWAIGGVADRVLRAGKIPVLLVRARQEEPLLQADRRTEETTYEPVCASET